MNVAVSDMSAKASDSSMLNRVREYWNDHVHDWKIADSQAGTRAFFMETEAYRFEKLEYLPRLVDFSGFGGQRLLDVGCGLGNDTARFAAGGASVVGIDIADRAVELARQNFTHRGLQGNFARMNGEELDFEDGQFDVVYCHTVLHFTPNPAHMINEIYRVLKPGGRAVLMTVNQYSWLRFLHLVMKTDIDYLDAPVFRSFSKREFAALLTPFPRAEIVSERFPVRTKVHHGIKARAYNRIFVDLFNALPRSWVSWSGHHLLAFVSK